MIACPQISKPRSAIPVFLLIRFFPWGFQLGYPFYWGSLGKWEGALSSSYEPSRALSPDSQWTLASQDVPTPNHWKNHCWTTDLVLALATRWLLPEDQGTFSMLFGALCFLCHKGRQPLLILYRWAQILPLWLWTSSQKPPRFSFHNGEMG